MKSVFEIPFTLPGMNQMFRMHWIKKTAIKKKVLWLILQQLHNNKVKRFPAKVRLVYTRYSIGEMDDDNLFSSQKFLRDALVQAAIIKDDSSSYIDKESSECLQVKVKHRKEQKTVLVVESI